MHRRSSRSRSLRKKFVGQIAYFGGLIYPSEKCIVNQGNWKISSNREDSNISLDSLSQSRVFVIGGPREKFTEHEINHLKKYLETGGSILVLLGTKGWILLYYFLFPIFLLASNTTYSHCRTATYKYLPAIRAAISRSKQTPDTSLCGIKK